MRFVLLLFIIIILAACQPNASNSTHSIEAPKLDETIPPTITVEKITNFSAHWLTKEIVVINKAFNSNAAIYLFQPSQPNNKVLLQAISSPDWLSEQFPHLAHFHAYRLDLPIETSKTWLKADLAVGQLSTNANNNNTLIDSTFVQIANVLDNIYTAGNNDANEVTDLGAVITPNGITFKLWAPTAIKVSLQLFELTDSAQQITSIEMQEDTATGIWHTQSSVDYLGKYYRYQLSAYHPRSKEIETFTTTDPYSLNLSVNSEYSHIIDLSASENLPNSWHQQKEVNISAPEDNIFYETHIRDYSAHDTS